MPDNSRPFSHVFDAFLSEYTRLAALDGQTIALLRGSRLAIARSRALLVRTEHYRQAPKEIDGLTLSSVEHADIFVVEVQETAPAAAPPVWRTGA